MIISATPEAIRHWNSIGDKIALDLLEDDDFLLFEHKPVKGIRIAGIGTHFGGQQIGFGIDEDGEWLDKKYWVNGSLDETFIFIKFKWPSH